MIVTTIIAMGLAFANETPTVISRSAVSYMGISSREQMSTMSTVFPRLMPKLGAFLGSHHLAPYGAPFIRYIRVNMKSELDIELGMPVKQTAPGAGPISPGVLPAGKYVSLKHFGVYSGLSQANAELQEWAKRKGIQFNIRQSKNGPEFVSRLELYNTDPTKQPDSRKWETQVLYMIRP